jgi:hypothetical protein
MASFNLKVHFVCVGSRHTKNLHSIAHLTLAAATAVQMTLPVPEVMDTHRTIVLVSDCEVLF